MASDRAKELVSALEWTVFGLTGLGGPDGDASAKRRSDARENLLAEIARLEAVAAAARELHKAEVEAYDSTVDWRLKEAVTNALAALDATTDGGDATKKGA